MIFFIHIKCWHVFLGFPEKIRKVSLIFIMSTYNFDLNVPWDYLKA